ncbi:MAG: tetratricopeptide repeat protein [Bacteroidales bacterium]|nr:tetratricopeptide repeat protein [Bacteroidales bacterium]
MNYLKSKRTLFALFLVTIVVFAIKATITFYSERLNNKAVATRDNTIRIAYLKRAMEMNSDNPLFQINLAFAYAETDSNISLLNFLSNNTLNSVEIDSAIIYAESACKRDSTNAVFCANAGILHFMKGNTPKAINYLCTAVRATNEKTILVALGLIAERNEDRVLATDSYTRAITIAPDLRCSQFFADLWHRDSLLAIEVENNALKKLRQQCEDNENTAARARLAKMLLDNGEFQQADSLLKIVITQLPNMNRPYLYLGNIAEVQGDTVSALQYYQTAQKLDEGDLLAIYHQNKLKGKNYKEYTDYVREQKTSNLQFRTSYVYGARLLKFICIKGFEQYIEPRIE